MDTFENLLNEVEEFTKAEADKLKKNRDDLTSKNTQKIEVGKDKRADEQHKDKLSDIRKKVAQEQQNVDNLDIDVGRLLNIQKQFYETCNNDEVVKRLRQETATEYTTKEKDEILAGIQSCYNLALENMQKALENFQKDYDRKLQESLYILRKCLEELEREKKFEFDGYNFKNSVSYQNAMKLNIDAIRKEAERTKTKAHTRVIANPIKQQKYKWYQFFEKIEQRFAPDTISEQVEDKYNLDFLKKTLDKTNSDAESLCHETREKYEKDYENIKEGIKKELDQLAKDLMQTEEAIQEQNQRIAELSEDINRLEKAKRQSEDTVLWLQTLKRKIEEV